MAPAHLNTGDDINLIFGLLSAILALLAIIMTIATWKLQRKTQHTIDRVQFQQVVFCTNIVVPLKKLHHDASSLFSSDSNEFTRPESMPPPYDTESAQHETG
jgi:hypothetical protein